MAETTPLDAAYREMALAPEDEAARMAFHATLADTPLWLLLEAEPEGQAIAPRIADTGDGAFVLAFDTEERLADFAAGAAAQAAMPGRALVAMLAGQGIGLGLNIGVAGCETVLPPDVLDWLAGVLAEGLPDAQDVRPEVLGPPGALPQPLLAALDARLARAGGLAQRAYLAGAGYADGRRGHLLAVIGTAPGAERAIAGSVAEAVRFAGAGTAGLDVAFFAATDPIAARLEKVALRFDLPQPPVPEAAIRAAPGSDPDKPPRLR